MPGYWVGKIKLFTLAMSMIKKICYIAVVIFIACGCKKSTPASSTPPATTASSLSIDGVAVSNLTHSSFINGSNFGVIAYGLNSNPELQVTFSGTNTPTSGTYAIAAGTVSYAKCLVTLSDTGYASSAASGYVNIVTSITASNNTLSFSNISVTGNLGHHIISGTITY